MLPHQTDSYREQVKKKSVKLRTAKKKRYVAEKNFFLLIAEN